MPFDLCLFAAESPGLWIKRTTSVGVGIEVTCEQHGRGCDGEGWCTRPDKIKSMNLREIQLFGMSLSLSLIIIEIRKDPCGP